MKLSQAIEGFKLSKDIEGLSKNTLPTYVYHLTHFKNFIGDIELEAITALDVKKFLAYLRHEYQPLRWNKDTEPLSERTIRNVWIALSSFYSWASVELDTPSPMAKIKAPKAEDNKSEPFSVEEVKRLIKAAEGGRQFQNRNRAMLLVLLDTGARASEFCGLSIFSLDLKAGRIEVTEGKGGKKRFVRIGVASRKALWKYISERSEVDPQEPLFLGQNGKALERTNLRKILKNIGDKAGVSNCYPHRFRYTFAIEYLRNGGDIFTLQELLGHSSLVMVRYYAKVAEVDTAKVHERAGPVDNWLR